MQSRCILGSIIWNKSSIHDLTCIGEEILDRLPKRGEACLDFKTARNLLVVSKRNGISSFDVDGSECESWERRKSSILYEGILNTAIDLHAINFKCPLEAVGRGGLSFRNKWGDRFSRLKFQTGAARVRPSDVNRSLLTDITISPALRSVDRLASQNARF